MTCTETIIDVRENLDIAELAMGRLLMDDYCLKIISGITNKSLSVRDLAFMYYIPLATCYKKVAQLESAGLIRGEGKFLSKDESPTDESVGFILGWKEIFCLSLMYHKFPCPVSWSKCGF